MTVILASGSIIRRSLLDGVGLEFAVERPAVDEEALKIGLPHGWRKRRRSR
jgi:predicted house-cleaning NTP pyrophosphatase (Maf/HAM1 superfamily)